MNLFEEGNQFLTKERSHANLTESPGVKEFVKEIILFQYLSNTLTAPEDSLETTVDYVVLGIHSPVSIRIESEEGDITGVKDGEVLVEIDGSQYIEFGGSKYILLPKAVEYEAELLGEDDGVYTMTVDTLSSENQQKNIHTLVSATTTNGMLASFQYENGEFSSIETDYDGDGTIDLEQKVDGEIIVTQTEYSYQDLEVAIKKLKLKRSHEKILLVKVKLIERFDRRFGDSYFGIKLNHRILAGLQSNFRWLERRNYITSSEQKELADITLYLKK